MGHVDELLAEGRGLATRVANGNFGALRLTERLQYFSHWPEIMRHCARAELTGEKLYLRCEEEFHGDWMAFGHTLDAEQQAERHPRHSGSERPDIRWT